MIATNFWAWHAHPEVWLLAVSVAGLYMWAGRTIGPKVVPAGTPPITQGQKRWFFAGVAVLWLASDWPMHDVGEQYLYLVHMIQHLLLTFVMPPLLLLGTPEWLARLVIGDGSASLWIKRFCRPVVAGVAYNAMVLLIHWPAVLNASVKVAALHFAIHLLLVLTATAWWMSICGPIPEWRLSLPAQMVYLFLMSVVPTVPGAWLTFADRPLYKAYDIPQRMFNISVTQDQQAAGLIMKLGGGAYLWTIITMLFFRWANRHEEAERRGRMVTEHDVLTWQKVTEEFERLGPAPAEHPGQAMKDPPATSSD